MAETVLTPAPCRQAQPQKSALSRARDGARMTTPLLPATTSNACPLCEAIAHNRKLNVKNVSRTDICVSCQEGVDALLLGFIDAFTDLVRESAKSAA